MSAKQKENRFYQFVNYLAKNGDSFYGFLVKIAIIGLFIISFIYAVFWVEDIEQMGDMGKVFIGIITGAFGSLVEKHIKNGVPSKGDTENR